MTTHHNVSYNSSRVQRAYKINNIETLKLKHKIYLLEKERLRNETLTNQDIRLISVTLDYIQTCSGHSVEGLSPGDGEPEEEEKRAQIGPTFLYGERIVSRQRRRNIRSQSVVDKSSSRMNSGTATSVSTMENTTRPQSNPNRRKTTFITHIRDDESVFDSSARSTKSGMSTPSERFKPAWLDEPITDVTKILLRANASNKRRESVFNRTSNGPGGSAALKNLTRSLRISSTSGMNDLSSASLADESSQSLVPERGTSITDILSRGPKSAMSASARTAHLNNAQSGSVSSRSQSQNVMESTKAMHSSRRSKVLRGRMKHFVAEPQRN